MLEHCSNSPESRARQRRAVLLHVSGTPTHLHRRLACAAALHKLPRVQRQEVKGFIAASDHNSLQPDITPQTNGTHQTSRLAVRHAAALSQTPFASS